MYPRVACYAQALRIEDASAMFAPSEEAETYSPILKAHDGNRTRDLFLTKEVLYRLSYMGILNSRFTCARSAPFCRIASSLMAPAKLERETGLEPATPSLEGSRSTN
jgi:hypothetical protein